MLRVVTLPITPVNGEGDINRPFMTLFTPFIADIISKSLNAELTIALNTTGIKSDISDLSSLEQEYNYLRYLKRLGIRPHAVFNDSDIRYKEYVSSVVQTLKEEEIIFSDEREIAWCDCGKVEIPIDAIGDIFKRYNPSGLIAGESLETAICKKCGSRLSKSKENIILINVSQNKIEVEPSLYSQEIKAASQRINSFSMCISRNHREGNSQFDTDFYWSNYLGYISKTDDNIILVTGSKTLNQAVKVILLAQMTCPGLKISLLVHPILEIRDKNLSLSTAKIEDYFHIMETSLNARMLLALGVQWSSMKSVIGSQDVHIVRLTSAYIVERNRMKIVKNIDRKFNKNDVAALYKKLRSQQNLVEDQICLLNCILPSL